MIRTRYMPLAVLSFVFAFLCADAGAAAPADPPAAQAPASPSAALPPLPEPEADWARMRTTGSMKAIGHAHEALGSFYAEGELAPDCASRLAAGDEALRTVPVAISLWQAAADCARKNGDEARAKHYDEAVTRLAVHALGRDSMAPGKFPIPVLNIDDVGTLVRATGMDEIYRYADLTRFGHYYPVVIAVWDEDRKLERHLAFDFLDVLARVEPLPGNDWDKYPGSRAQLREALLKAQLAEHQIVARDIDAIRKAGDLSGEDAVAALRDAAADGGLGALRQWLAACDGKPKACGAGAVDALLPRAEDGLALYRVQLAMAQARGIGVARDLDAAWVLLDSAEARLPGRAVAEFAILWHELDPAHPLPKPARERLDRAAAAGRVEALAELFRIGLRSRGEEDQTLDPATLALGTKLAELGSTDAAYMLYLHHDATGDKPTSLQWIRRGADAGDKGAMYAYAFELIDGDKGPKDVRAGLDWMRRAALAGSSGAMEWMGHRAERGEHWQEAEHWFDSCIQYNDEDCVLASAELHAKPHPGIEFSDKRSGELYAILHRYDDTPDVRRSHAAYLLGQVPADTVRARALLEQDANAGDARSQFLLGSYLSRGRLGPADAKAGMAWMQKAVATEKEAADSLANHLYYRERTPQARARALEIERGLTAGGMEGAANNLAWWLCVNPDAAQRNPVEGLQAVSHMPPTARMHWGQLDTAAACLAANGEFDKAIELQSQAVAEAGILLVPPRVDAEMRARLELYRRRQPYLEQKQDEDPEE